MTATQTGEWCARLRLQLSEADRTLERVQLQPLGLSAEAQLSAESHLEELAAAIRAKRAAIGQAALATDASVQQKIGADSEHAVQWKADRDFLLLSSRADQAEAYAAACFELASAAVREAAHAVTAATLARRDADIASFPKRLPGSGPARG